MRGTLRVRADRLLDVEGTARGERPELIVRDGVIWRVGDEAAHTDLPPEAVEIDLPGLTLVPGLVDVHTHLTLGTGSRTYEDVMEHDSDHLMAIRSVLNAREHLRAGVTTLRDCGGRGFITVAVRQAAEAGLFLGPRILAAGPPITPTGGHFWWCGAEADGPDAVRRQARFLLKSGVDFLKIMASGGGTVGTDSRFSSFEAEEIRAATQEARRVGKKTTAHAIAKAGIAAAVDGGIDQIEHISFQSPDGQYAFDEVVAKRLVDNGIIVSPTIQTGYRQLEAARALERPSEQETRRRIANEEKLTAKLSFISRFKELGATIVAGTDAIQRFGDYALGLRLLHEGGLSEIEVLRAATIDAARALGLADIGLLRPGYVADVVAVAGDPSVDVTSFERVKTVIRAGVVVANEPDTVNPGASRT
jgi:imidazolonepropionase-like amidohydrolase